MKLFFSEFKADYGHYRFPYQVWLLKEEGEAVEKIYGNGFLPIRSLPNIYYLARGVRVNLSEFTPSSENRRILKRTESFTAEAIPLKQFNYDSEVQKLCRDYAEKRLGKDVFPVPAIRSVFTGEVYNQVFIFKDQKEKPVGYAVCFTNDQLLQYAHAFYDLNYLSESLGARMMLEAVSWAKDKGCQYAYLGTCYDEGALYKTEFVGVEFFNGFGWSRKLAELKALLKRENEEYLLKDKDYLDSFHEGDLHKLLSNYGIRVNF
jgi:hypothetical protein